jgi:electron transfer flavoprotein alpha subunit
MMNLVLAEHDNTSIRAATLNTIAAAQKIGGGVPRTRGELQRTSCCGCCERIAGVNKVSLADPLLLDSRLRMACGVETSMNGSPHPRVNFNICP